MKNRKIIVIELDGGSWNIINPLIEEAKLPNIKRLIENGASGQLISVLPAISPKIWTSIFSGKKHHKTGIDFFGGNSKMVKCKRVWDIFSEKGLKVGIFGSFVTWPPYRVKGFMIPAVDSLGTETYPSEYEFFQEIALNERKKIKRIRSKKIGFENLFYYAYKLKTNGVSNKTFLHTFNYFVQEKIRRFNQKDKYWRKLILHAKISTEFFIALYRLYQPHFANFHIHICDSTSHRYWAFYEPSKFDQVDRVLVKKYKDVIPNAYVKADESIGKILSQVDEHTTVIVASDHGFKALLGAIKPYDLNISRFLDVLGLRQKVVAARFGPGLYLYFQHEELMNNIAGVLRNAELREIDEKVFNVRLFEKILIVTKPNWRVDVSKIKEDSLIDFGKYGIYKFHDIFTPQETEMSGVHKKEGILILSGPNIKAGARIENPSIYDITPTILTLMGYSVARDMDGRVLTEALTDEFLSGNPVIYIDSYENSFIEKSKLEEVDHKKIEERLESLGYL